MKMVISSNKVNKCIPNPKVLIAKAINNYDSVIFCIAKSEIMQIEHTFLSNWISRLLRQAWDTVCRYINKKMNVRDRKLIVLRIFFSWSSMHRSGGKQR